MCLEGACAEFSAVCAALSLHPPLCSFMCSESCLHSIGVLVCKVCTVRAAKTKEAVLGSGEGQGQSVQSSFKPLRTKLGIVIHKVE